jgi:hypothetical protein
MRAIPASNARFVPSMMCVLNHWPLLICKICLFLVIRYFWCSLRLIKFTARRIREGKVTFYTFIRTLRLEHLFGIEKLG